MFVRSSSSRQQAFTLVEIVVALTIIAVIAAVAIPTLKGIREEEKAREPVVAVANLVQEVRQRAIQERRPYQIVFEREAVHACADSFPFSKREDFLKYLEEQRQPVQDQNFVRPQPERVGDPTSAARAAGAAGVAQSVSSAGLGGGMGALSSSSFASSSVYPRPITPDDPVISYEELSAAQSRAKQEAAADQAKADEEGEVAVAKDESAESAAEGPWIVTIPLPEKTACEVLLWGDSDWQEIEGDKIRRWVFQPSGVASPARIRLRTDQAELEASFDAITGEISSEKSRLLSMWP